MSFFLLYERRGSFSYFDRPHASRHTEGNERSDALCRLPLPTRGPSALHPPRRPPNASRPNGCRRRAQRRRDASGGLPRTRVILLPILEGAWPDKDEFAVSKSKRRNPSYGGGEDHASFRRLMTELMSADGTIPAVWVS